MELAAFLAQAKISACACQDQGGYRILEDESREFVYAQGDLSYRDRYFGFSAFAGEEVVFCKGKPLWVMNYCGELAGADVPGDEVYGFLGKALAELSDTVPFRGPKLFSEDRYVYLNHVEGELGRFKGEEFILLDGKKVYRLYYCGGFLRWRA